MQKKILIIFSIIFSLQAMEENSVMDIEKMTLDEKIGQMLIAAVVSNPTSNAQFMRTVDYYAEPIYAQEMIKKYNIGGILVIGNSLPYEHVLLVNELQAHSKYPLFVFCDTAECTGLSMRMTQDVTVYPKAMTLGALDPDDDFLIYQLGVRIAQENKLMGIHCGLGPVGDVNYNPFNPVINTRSLGEDPATVTRKLKQYIHGLKDGKLLVCIKHWPGHGNTHQDSHLVLPEIKANEEKLKQTELVPFQAAIDNKVDIVMTAHLDVPALTEKKGLPVSLSKNAITFLREKMGHHNLVMTDGLGMKGVTAQYRPEDIAVRAVHAGTDILLCPVDIPRAFCGIKRAIEKNEINESDIDEHVTRIINAKRAANIQKTITIDATLFQEFIAPAAKELKKKLYRAAITLARNKKNRLPMKNSTTSIPVVTIAERPDMSKPFVAALQQHCKITHHMLSTRPSSGECNQLLQKLKSSDRVITSLHLPSRSGMIEMDNTVPDYIDFINQLDAKATLVLFANPYNLAHLPYSGATIVAYENEPEAQEAAAEVLMGKYNPRGHLPVSTEGYPAGTSLRYPDQNG